MKKTLLAAIIVAAMAGSTMGAQLLTGGNIPLINNIVGVGVMTLDFSSASPLTGVEIGNFIINCNGNSFDVSWTFTNLGKFRKNVNEAIDMTLLNVRPHASQPAGSNLGTLCEVLVPATAWDAGVTKSAGNFLAQAALGACTYVPSDQTDATTNYAIQMRAAWLDASDKLAGLYTETITFTILATVN